MLVLAFDTATPAVTVAVGDAGQILAQQTVVDARRQGELLTVCIEDVLAEARVTHGDLDAVASGAGPGPYTGLRVGLVTARVLGSALGIAAYGFCTLDIIAAEATEAAAGLPVAGEGAHAYPEPLGEPIAPRYPSAATAVTWCAARLAAGEPLGPPDPMYLRRPDARVPGALKSVLAAR